MKMERFVARADEQSRGGEMWRDGDSGCERQILSLKITEGHLRRGKEVEWGRAGALCRWVGGKRWDMCAPHMPLVSLARRI